MDENSDFEELMAGYRPELAPDLKERIMVRYTESPGAEHRPRWWKRPVPLYKAAAAALLLGAVSLFAGATMFPGHSRPIPAGSGSLHTETATSIRIEPVIAVNSRF